MYLVTPLTLAGWSEMTDRSKNALLNSREYHWHDAAIYPRALGCSGCTYIEECGGLNIGKGIFNCFSFCQDCNPSECDRVCPKNPINFSLRFREVGGFPSTPMPRVEVPQKVILPKTVALIKNGFGRSSPLQTDFIGLPLRKLVNLSNMSLRFEDRADLCKYFKISSKTNIVLCGVGKDNPIEKLWLALENKEVRDFIKQLNPALVTTPNFSLFNNVPRTDNLHSIRRIMMCWYELASSGIRTAIHINARTDKDYETWISFINDHPEIHDVSFEFGTGAGYGRRFRWHLNKIQEFYMETGQRLRMIVRGRRRFDHLAKFVSEIVLIDTETFVKTHKRFVASIGNSNRINWFSLKTRPGEHLDEMFNLSLAVSARDIEFFYQKDPSRENTTPKRKNPGQKSVRKSSPVEQLALFHQLQGSNFQNET